MSPDQMAFGRVFWMATAPSFIICNWSLRLTGGRVVKVFNNVQRLCLSRTARKMQEVMLIPKQQVRLDIKKQLIESRNFQLKPAFATSAALPEIKSRDQSQS